jgi:RES domain
VITAYRHAAYDTPWWATPMPRAGRFHRVGDPATQYLSRHPLGPAAELLRHHVGPTTVEDADTVLLDLWAVQLPEDGLIEIDFDTCSDLGLTPDELVGEDYGPCQRVAEAQRRAGGEGLIVPSAALPGTSNLVLFGARVSHPYAAEPVTPEEVRTGHLTDGARPAAELLALVRWIGTPHRALTQWRTTGRYARLDDPLATR